MIHDITRDLFGAERYPGDPAPISRFICRIDGGDSCNLSALSLGLHNGTHIDAPLHFIEDGADITQIPLDACIGDCDVVLCDKPLIERGDVAALLRPDTTRLLLKGGALLHPTAARQLAAANLVLLGTDQLSVSSEIHNAQVHRTLLGSGMVLLECLNLADISPGRYTLCALPLKITGVEASPCRAILVDII